MIDIKTKVTDYLRGLLTPAVKRELGMPSALPAKVAGREIADSGGDIRHAISQVSGGELTSMGVLVRLKMAREGHTAAFVQVVEDLLQRDLNYASARASMTEAVGTARLVARPNGVGARERAIAEDVQALLDGDAVQSIIEHLCSFDDFGYAAAELVWDFEKWTLAAAIPLPPAWIAFDRNDGRTPYLLPDVAGGPFRPLDKGRFLYLTRDGYGLPALRSIGYGAAFNKSLKSMTVKDWAGWLEGNGQPLRIGYYDPDTADRDELARSQRALKKILENVGVDSWAMLPEGSKIEFIESTTKGSSAAGYEAFVRFLNEENTKRVMGAVLTTGTGNTGSGGTQALGNVHSGETARKVRNIASYIAHSIRESIVTCFVQWRYGVDTLIPHVSFEFDVPDDLLALAAALKDLVPLGLQVSQEEVRERLGLRAPRDGEQLLAMPSATVPETADV